MRTIFDTRGDIGVAQRVTLWLLAAGALLRLLQFLIDRALWLDESWVVGSVLDRSFADFLHPASLEFGKTSPFGFYLLEKVATLALGPSTLALRLVPLLCGLISLPLFLACARAFNERRARPLAVGLFALSGPLIYYSSEVKPYAGDLAIALALTLLARTALAPDAPRRRLAWLAAAGALALWFSYAAPFVLAGVALCGLGSALARLRIRELGEWTALAALWFASFVALWQVSIAELARIDWLVADLHQHWTDQFVPLGAQALPWLARAFVELFAWPAGIPAVLLAAPLFLVGSWTTATSDRAGLFLLLAPLLLACAASAWRLYPFGGRAILFAVPPVMLLIAAGATRVARATPRPTLALAVAASALLFEPAFAALTHLTRPHIYPPHRTPQELARAIDHVEQHWRDGDHLYVHFEAQWAFDYYRRFLDEEVQYTLGSLAQDDLSDYAAELDPLLGRDRAWVVFSDIVDYVAEHETWIVRYLESRGTLVDRLDPPGASLYLFDLSESE